MLVETSLRLGGSLPMMDRGLEVLRLRMMMCRDSAALSTRQGYMGYMKRSSL